nr:hypothetical protein [uncultured bacterium]
MILYMKCKFYAHNGCVLGSKIEAPKALSSLFELKSLWSVLQFMPSCATPCVSLL